MEPEILILDEATSELDPIGAEEVHDLAYSLRKQGKTVLMVEHNIDELAQVADRIIVMDQGKIVMDAPIREVLAQVDLLCDLGIYPPQVTQTAFALQKHGVAVGDIPITLDEGIALVKRINQDA
jgi:energy-coupling factor transport system ATP-binding protein